LSAAAARVETRTAAAASPRATVAARSVRNHCRRPQGRAARSRCGWDAVRFRVRGFQAFRYRNGKPNFRPVAVRVHAAMLRLLPEPAMRRLILAGFSAALTLAAVPAAFAQAPRVPTSSTAAANRGPITLTQIMADPDWIGPPVEAPYWSVDSRIVYYRLKRNGNQLRDLYRVNADGGAGVKLDDAQLAQADGDPVFDRAHAHAAFFRHNDVFLRDVAGGATHQLTRDGTRKHALRFSADGAVLSWREGDNWMIYRLDEGLLSPAATLKTEDDPEQDKPDDLQREQLRLFSTLRDIKADKDAQRDRQRELDARDVGRAVTPFYLGDDV